MFAAKRKWRSGSKVLFKNLNLDPPTLTCDADFAQHTLPWRFTPVRSKLPVWNRKPWSYLNTTKSVVCSVFRAFLFESYTSLLVSGLFVCRDIANHICPTNPPDKYWIKSASIYMMYVDILEKSHNHGFLHLTV